MTTLQVSLNGRWTSLPTLAVEEKFQNYEHLQSICNVSPLLYVKINYEHLQSICNVSPLLYVKISAY
jgi:hypothetical protein